MRAWLHASGEYHTADNAFVLFSKEQLYQADWRAYVICKLYLRLIDVAMDDVLAFTSVEQWRAQKLAQRRNLTMPWGVAPPPLLGVAYYCEGCNKWAHSVVKPSREYTGLPPAAAQRQRQTGGKKKGGIVPLVVPRTVKHYRRNKQTTKRPRPWVPRAMGLGDGRGHCMTGMALNPLDGQKYCIRGHLDTNKQEAALVAAEAEQEQHEQREALEKEQQEAEDSDTEDMDLALSDVEEEDDDDDDSMEEEEEEEEEDDDDDEEEQASRRRAAASVVASTETAATTTPGGGRKKASSKPDLSRLLLAPELTCRGRPLSPIDLTGVYKRLGNRLVSRCVYCARPCEVVSSNVTNRGLSCGEHALVHEYPVYHRIWRHIQRPLDADKDIMEASRLPHRCCKCQQYDSQGMTTVWVYDVLYKLARVSLCRNHANGAKPELPRPMHGQQPVPVRWNALKSQLDHAG